MGPRERAAQFFFRKHYVQNDADIKTGGLGFRLNWNVPRDLAPLDGELVVAGGLVGDLAGAVEAKARQ